jgi:hypothetical protein
MAKRATARKANPKGGKYDRCVKAVAKRGGANPYAVCSKLRGNKGKKKRKNPLGAGAMLVEEVGPGVIKQAGKELHIKVPALPISNRGRKPKKKGQPKARRNPGVKRNSLEGSREVYAGFHGRPSEQDVRIVTPIHQHKYLAGLGELVKLEILTQSESYKVIVTGFSGALLCSNERRSQLFIEGGDQSVDLDDFGIREPVHESEVLGELLVIEYYTIKDHLGDDGGEATYRHKLRRFRFRRRPMVVYDTINKLLSISGGNYDIPDEGIRD